MDYQTNKHVPLGHWNDFSNHIQFRDYLATKLNLKTSDDWYNVSTNEIRNMGGNGLLNSKYEGKTLRFLKAVFPDTTWYPWLFKNTLKKFWSDNSTQHLFLQWLSNRLSWSTRQDYYKLTTKLLKDNKGSGLLNYYNQSSLQLLNGLLSPPEGDDEWYPWLFDGSTPNNYWDYIENRRKYADWLYKRLGFTKMEDWYTVSQDTFRENYGSGLILNPRTYNSSHIAFLKDVYPDYNFLPWLFSQTTQGYWKTLENRISAVKWLGEQCGFKKVDDWYGICREDIRHNSLGGLAVHYYNDSISHMIIECNPQIVFDSSKFNIYKTERKITAYLTKHNIQFVPQYKIHKGRKNGWFKMDAYLLDLGICIEIDGPQHFRQVRTWLHPLLQKKRDVFKMNLLKEKGIRCIRLVQEEVLENPESWLDTHLLPLLCKLESIEPSYITTQPDNQTLYDEHKMLHTSGGVSIDELYDGLDSDVEDV
jgi:very-short-patch-repair endonuclease